jgi:myosin heavy subunit
METELCELRKRAEEGGGVAKELEIARSTIAGLQTNLEYAKGLAVRYDEQEKLLSNEKSHNKALYRQVDGLRSELDAKRSECEVLEVQAGKKSGLEKTIEGLQLDLASARKQATMATSLEKENQAKSAEVTTLNGQLKEALESVSEKNYLVEEKLRLSKQLAQCRKELSVTAGLENTIKEKDASITDLKNSLTIAQSHAQQMDELVEQNARLEDEFEGLHHEVQDLATSNQALAQQNAKIPGLEAALKKAKVEADKVSELEKQQAALETRLSLLTTDLDVARGENAQVTPLKTALEKKQMEIDKLQKQQSDVQQTVLRLEGELSNAHADLETAKAALIAAEVQEAARSASSGEHQQKPARDSANSGSSTPNLTGATSVIPETQIEVPEFVPQEFDCLEFINDLDEAQSDLTSISDEDEFELAQDELPAPVLKGKQLDQPSTESLTHRATDSGISTSATKHTPVAVARSESTKDSSYRTALAHNTGPKITGLPSRSRLDSDTQTSSSSLESHNEQMLLDEASQEVADVDSQDANSPIAMPWNPLRSTLGPSPRRLRSGSQGQPRLPGLPSGQQPASQPQRVSTPMAIREKPLPNSAVKRRIEPEAEIEDSQEPPKKLKRRPANMEVRKPTTPGSNSFVPAARPPITYRRSSSSTIVGTSAPAPGTAQRTVKSGRNKSKNNRYAARFAPASQ